jgi:aspartyl-tRNA(Asn)/glutamyl-tRNA(Gln) amidotransferase subunit B
MSEYEAVIGLEIHVQLETRTKLFCSCPNSYGKDPNTLVCPVCLGLPGSLPVLNEEAVKHAIKVALALDAEIHRESIFYRKNYFYPDLPKGYQITQYTRSIATEGKLIFTVENEKRRVVRIERMNIEEEAAKSIHTDEGDVLLDFNRSGIPLLEIVTYPDINSPKEARAFLENLKRLLRYLKVSSCDMEKGQLRVDANLSVRPKGREELGVKVELKNLNSFKAVEDALQFELERQREVIKSGGRVFQETRLWDERARKTTTMRVKEEARDYRYFPEPDLLPLVISDDMIEEIEESLPELPSKKFERFVREYGIPFKIADVLIEDNEIADYFEEVTGILKDPVLSANWITTEILRVLKEKDTTINNLNLPPSKLAELLSYIKKGELTHTLAKTVFEKMLEEGRSAKEIIEREGLIKVGDVDTLERFVNEAIESFPDLVEKYKKGKKGVIGVLIGDVMKKTKGQADAKIVRELFEKKLE